MTEIPYSGKSFKQVPRELVMMQVLRPLELGILTVVMLIGILALSTELVEYEAIAKIVVIPSLILLIGITGYAMFKTYKVQQLR